MTVYLGIIDADYQGEILILMSSIANITFKIGDKIAQILLFPYIPVGQSNQERKGGFGSTNIKYVYWAMNITRFQPHIKIQVAGQVISGLIDTGSDITIINKKIGQVILLIR